MNDKKLHIIAGLVIALAVALPAYLESLNLFAGLWVSLTSGIIAGGVKEWCDNVYGGRWDWKDFAFTCIGVGLAMVFIVVVYLIF